MSTDICCSPASNGTSIADAALDAEVHGLGPAVDGEVHSIDAGVDDGVQDGWQALADAALGRLLTAAELAAVQHLPADVALDLLFPRLDDAARHEALWALG